MADKRNSDFSVGYGKPPVHSRFPKGKSGNPKGRPWAYKNMSALLNEVLSQCITVSEGGKRKRMPKRKAMLTQLVNKALSGEVRSIRLEPTSYATPRPTRNRKPARAVYRWR